MTAGLHEYHPGKAAVSSCKHGILFPWHVSAAHWVASSSARTGWLLRQHIQRHVRTACWAVHGKKPFQPRLPALRLTAYALTWRTPTEARI